MPDIQVKCRIVVDAMGGDYVPQNPVIGAIEAMNENSNIDLYLVGNEKEITKVLHQNNLSFSNSNIINSDEIINMKDSPTDAIRKKKDSSIVIGATLVKENKADAFVSAGNTGAMMAASTLIIGRIPGFGRPTIGASFPTTSDKVCTVYDVGASVDCKPVHLMEYAIMGTIYAEEMNDIENPSIGLLSVGEEESKGNAVSLAAYDLLKNSKLNFIGNVEGRDILNAKVDIVVCDGYVGNIILKFGESVIPFLRAKIKNYAYQGFINKVKVLFSKGTLKESLKDMDYQTHGGVPLLGINGISIIGHGSSSPLALKNMVLKAEEMFSKKLIQKLEDGLKIYGS